MAIWLGIFETQPCKQCYQLMYKSDCMWLFFQWTKKDSIFFVFSSCCVLSPSLLFASYSNLVRSLNIAPFTYSVYSNGSSSFTSLAYTHKSKKTKIPLSPCKILAQAFQKHILLWGKQRGTEGVIVFRIGVIVLTKKMTCT